MTHITVHSPSSHGSTKASTRSNIPGAGPGSRLSGERIAASASAITLNAVIAMLMLAPLAAPHLMPRMDKATEAIWIPRDPPPLVEPIPVPVVARPLIQQPVTQPVRREQVSPPVVVATAEPNDIHVAFEAIASESSVSGPVTSIASTQTGAQLQYASAPPPPYPREALRAGQGGTVLLQVLVDVDGKPLQVEVERSSGHRALDRAAQRHVLERWTFRPAVQDGRPVRAIGLVPVEFSLH